MYKLENNLLTIKDEIINKANSIITLSTDVTDTELFGILTFNDGSERLIQFQEKQIQYVYTARLFITEEDIPLLSNVKLTILSISNGLKRKSNAVQLVLDFNSIKQTVTISASKQLVNLKLEVLELKKHIEKLINGRALQNINLINKDYIQKGMIPVADDTGNFIASYPFINFVTEINGIQAENGSIILPANMIQYNQDKTVYTALQEVINALTALNNSITTLTEQQKALNNRLISVELELEANKNSSII